MFVAPKMNLKGVVGMDLREITYFLAIADEGYLTKAAQRLHVTQPTLSHFLAKLEKNLGVELFYRRNLVGLELTPAGRIYYDSARRIDHIWQSTLKSLEDSRDERLMATKCVGPNGVEMAFYDRRPDAAPAQPLPPRKQQGGQTLSACPSPCASPPR